MSYFKVIEIIVNTMDVVAGTWFGLNFLDISKVSSWGGPSSVVMANLKSKARYALILILGSYLLKLAMLFVK